LNRTSTTEKEDKDNEINGETLDIKITENKKIKGILKDIISNRSINIVFCTSCGGLLKPTNNKASNCYIDSKCTKMSSYYCYTCEINYCTYCVRDIRNGKCSKGHLLFKILNLYNENCKNCQNPIQSEGYNCNLCNITICWSCYNIFNGFVDYNCDKCKINLRWGKYYFEVCSNCANFTICHWSCFFCKYYYCSKCLIPKTNFCGSFHYLDSYTIEGQGWGNIHDTGDMTQNITKTTSFNTKESEKISIVSINSINSSTNYNSINQLSPVSPLGYICSKCENVFCNKYKCCNRCNYQLCSECK